MLKELLKRRGALIEILLAAFLLALGVNLLASAIVSLVNLRDWLLLLMSCSIVFLAILLFARKIFDSRHIERSIEALFLYDKKSSLLIRIPRYRFSEAISDYIGSLFIENEAAKTLWERDPLDKQFDFDAKTQHVTHRDTESSSLIREAVEYFVLDRLSTHLTDFFNKPSYDKTLLRELCREDVPSILFKNRFLDTFSRPMSERAAFVDDVIEMKSSPGRIMAMSSPKGRYEHFDLVLPSKARVNRIAEGEIEVCTPKFDLRIKVIYDGINSVLPSSFEEHYLGLSSHRDYTTYQVGVRFSVVFRTGALFTKSGWDYHIWLDSFLDALEQDFCVDRFLRRINWEHARTVIDMMDLRAQAGLRNEESQDHE